MTMIKKVEDYSKPVDEIDYETKKRKKRRRGEEITEKPKKKAPPYKREHLNLLVEDDEWQPLHPIWGGKNWDE